MPIITQTLIEDTLREIIDPELGFNIVDLGLIYSIMLSESKESVGIVMTMTTPGCPAEGYITSGVRRRLEAMGMKQVDVHVVWSPPWQPDMISDSIKKYFGL